MFNVFDNFTVICSDFNNRNYSKNFADYQIDLLKHHKHYGCNFAFIFQYWNDIDVAIRQLSTRLFLLEKSWIPLFIKRKKIEHRISMDKETKQINDEYYFIPIIGTRHIFSPTLWKMFNTYKRKRCYLCLIY